jgi:membrane fusion protein (multidrug efflux system)
MIIVPLNQLWVNANFKESQLKNIRIGQPAQLISDAYGRSVKYHGTVVGLSPGTGSTFDLLPPQNATGNWIKIVQRLPVRIAIDPKQLQQNPLRIGLSITAKVDTHNRQGAVLTAAPQNKVIYQTKDYSAELQAADALINQILQANAVNVTPPSVSP